MQTYYNQKGDSVDINVYTGELISKLMPFWSPYLCCSLNNLKSRFDILMFVRVLKNYCHIQHINKAPILLKHSGWEKETNCDLEWMEKKLIPFLEESDFVKKE